MNFFSNLYWRKDNEINVNMNGCHPWEAKALMIMYCVSNFSMCNKTMCNNTFFLYFKRWKEKMGKRGKCLFDRFLSCAIRGWQWLILELLVFAFSRCPKWIMGTFIWPLTVFPIGNLMYNIFKWHLYCMSHRHFCVGWNSNQ